MPVRGHLYSSMRTHSSMRTRKEQYAAPREGLERGRAERAHRGADLSALLRQYLYFCTSKASKPTTC
jgi:hypothetical protein